MNWLIGYTADFSAEDYSAVYDSLSPSRKAHIDTFRHTGARQQSLAGELLLRRLLKKTGINATILRLPSGQPVLSGSDACVSITHCEALIACAVSDCPIGIDAEKLRPVKPGMLQRICTPEELLYAGDDPVRFFEIWTAKEAWFKMRGTGITDFQSVNTLDLPRQLIRQGDYLIQIVYEQKR